MKWSPRRSPIFRRRLLIHAMAGIVNGIDRKAVVAEAGIAIGLVVATALVEAEMVRLDARLPDLEPAVRTEVLHTVRRVADKLLHQPTIRVKELADQQIEVSYAAALAELFALDPEAVDAVTRAEGLAP